MDFASQLRKYLDNPPGGVEPQVRLRQIDASELHAHLLERLRGIESAEARWLIEDVYREWSIERVQRFARYLETVSSPLAGMNAQEARTFATRVIDQAIGYDHPDLGIVDRLELQRIARAFEGGDIQQYALENRLVVIESQHETRITNLGRAFLRLRGRDTIRWLLTAEVSQSTGRWDKWRTPRQLLAEALNGIDAVFANETWHYPYARETLDRLDDLAVLSVQTANPDGAARRYTVRDPIVDLVRAVLDAGPWHAAVAALLDDETSAALQSRVPSTAAASEQLTKLITHEVRNALVPVRHHIDALRAANIDTAMVQRIDKARRGVVRVLEFVDDLVATSDLLSEPYTSCEVTDVIREAIRWADGGERVELVAGAPARVHAPRSRLVRAINNVILNALHATSPDGTVRASFHVVQGVVGIMIDDGGPGIPVDLRRRIFDEGYTTRGGPGHGFGLAFVRSVVEGALQGKVWCEASPLGGARFVLAIAEDKKP